MKTRNFLAVLLAGWLGFCLTASARAADVSMIPPDFKKIAQIDFSNWTAGQWYTREKMTHDWNPRQYNGDKPIIPMGIVHNRAIVAENEVFKSGRAMRVLLPKEKFSPAETGAQIFASLVGQEEIYFGVSIYLPKDFECGRETKLPPGIYGGWKLGTGGITPDGVKIGPSLRADMQYCRANSYVYHLNQRGDNGDGKPYHNPLYGDKFRWKYADGRQVVFTPGEKHDIMFYAKMNTPGEKNGQHRVWFNGQLVLSLSNLEFRKDPNLKFDTIGSEIFQGGANKSFATAKDNIMDVGDFLVFVRK